MDIFDVLSLVGGLALFLYGMNVMGASLEKKAGGQLKSVLGKMTDNPFKGFLLGLVVTSALPIGSSSAITLPMAFIIAFFYTYTGILGLNFAIIDIISFFVAIILGEYISYKPLCRVKFKNEYGRCFKNPIQ